MSEQHSLTQEVCEACRVGAPRVTEDEKNELMPQIPEWSIVLEGDQDMLVREYSFGNFVEALAFTNKIGELAESLNHHPDITTSWGKVTLVWYTHKIGGLHRNDFRCAAKSDQLYP